jgi:hypothetical protein
MQLDSELISIWWRSGCDLRYIYVAYIMWQYGNDSFAVAVSAIVQVNCDEIFRNRRM